MTAVERLNVTLSGVDGAQPIVFAHGFGCDQNMWRKVAPHYEDAFQVVLFDYVGAGNSDLTAYDPSTYSSLDGYAGDVLDLCHELGLESAIFVGHSVSSMVGVLAAIREPDLFDKLVMVGPSARYIDDDGYVGGFSRSDIDELLESMESNYLGWSHAMAPAIMSNADDQSLSNELEASFCRTDPEIAQQFAEVTFLSDNRADLDQLTTDTLVLQCKQDIIAPFSAGEFVHAAIPGSTFVVLDATGHCPHVSAPVETVAAIDAFIRAPRS